MARCIYCWLSPVQWNTNSNAAIRTSLYICLLNMDVCSILSLCLGKLNNPSTHFACVSIMPRFRNYASLEQVLNLVLLHVWSMCICFCFLIMICKNTLLTRHLLCIPPTLAFSCTILPLLQ